MENGPIVSIRAELRPGDVERVIELHRALYPMEYGFDQTFVHYVAVHMEGFARSMSERERMWIVEREGRTMGSIALVRASETEAQLRWLLLHPELRGMGLGRKLMEGALSFCREKGYSSAFLWTADVLLEAASLYRSLGFKLTEENRHEVWGVLLSEQRYEKAL